MPRSTFAQALVFGIHGLRNSVNDEDYGPLQMYPVWSGDVDDCLAIVSDVESSLRIFLEKRFWVIPLQAFVP